MGKIIKYRFNIESVSPIFFGSEEKGQLLRNSDGNPFITGNSIGGAIRSFLSRYNEEKVIKHLGGIIEKTNDKETEEDKIEFIKSSVTISDGRIESTEKNICIKEGTKVDRLTATANDGSKYEFEYLSIGTKIYFDIQRECDDETEKEFKEIIKEIAVGINKTELTLGGQTTNGFGRFKIIEILEKEFNLNTIEGLERYIFKRNHENWEKLNIQYDSKATDYNKVTFIMTGNFPYGVYQNYDIKSSFMLSGIQKSKDGYYIPASSIKGLLRSQVEKLYNSLGACGEEFCIRLFGGKDSIGKIRFEDVDLSNAKEIQVYKARKMAKEHDQEDSENDNKYPTYNKVDRLVGSSYSNALFSQRDIEGEASIKFTLNESDDYKSFIYPILIILRNIGLGITPVGGRTSIGLGEFNAQKIGIVSNEYKASIIFDNAQDSIIIDNKDKIRELKKAFEESLK